MNLLRGFIVLTVILSTSLLSSCDRNDSQNRFNACLASSFCGIIELGKEQSVTPWVVKLWKAGSQTPLAIDQNYLINEQFILTPDPTQYSTSDTLYITANNQTEALWNKVILATVLGQSPENSDTLVINEITTVATAYSFAQFWQDEGPDSEPSIGTSAEKGTGDTTYDLAVGIPNAATMWRNIATLEGATSFVLHHGPNIEQRTYLNNHIELTNFVLGVVNSLANMVQAASLNSVNDYQSLTSWLNKANEPTSSTMPCGEGTTTNNILLALANMAKFPQHCSDEFYALSLVAPTPYKPEYNYKNSDVSDLDGLGWMIAILFNGTTTPDGFNYIPSEYRMNGPANFAINYEGIIWVNNNYYENPTLGYSCASNVAIRLKPDGSYLDTNAQGNGLYGVGYGIAMNTETGNVWLPNFGFTTEQCPPPLDRDKSISVFGPDGEAVALFRDLLTNFSGPQGLSNGNDKMYLSGCDSNTLATVKLDGEFDVWEITEEGNRPALQNPFDTAFHIIDDNSAQLWVSGNQSQTLSDNNVGAVYLISFDPLTGEPPYNNIQWFYNDKISRPMGIDTNSQGTAWAANSASVNIPCGRAKYKVQSNAGWISAITTNGDIKKYEGGGLGTPWGVWVDSKDNVWIANFNSQKVSRLCGNTEGCQGGINYGEFFVKNGYRFLGYDRLTATRADPSGNLWAANNWLFTSTQETNNPGGKEVVAIIGMANPEKGQGPAN